LSDEVAACISGVEVVTTRIPGSEPVDLEHTSKIKFWDKRASLELLGRHLKLFTDKIEFTDKVAEKSYIERLRRAKARLKADAGRQAA
jgi:phage terminase small subunit